MKWLLLLILTALLAGCASSAFLYYGDSSHAYYKAVKRASEGSVQEYQRSLEKVFTRSAERGLPAPPGLYCDYAMLLISQNETARSREYLLKEKASWPESAVFIDFLMAKYGLSQ
jgi:hypothetical protein